MITITQLTLSTIFMQFIIFLYNLYQRLYNLHYKIILLRRIIHVTIKLLYKNCYLRSSITVLYIFP